MFNMFLYFTRVYMTARSIILTAYHALNQRNVISCPLETSDGHCLTSVQLTRSCQFFLVKRLRFILSTDHLLFGNSF